MCYETVGSQVHYGMLAKVKGWWNLKIQIDSSYLHDLQR